MVDDAPTNSAGTTDWPEDEQRKIRLGSYLILTTQINFKCSKYVYVCVSLSNRL